MAYTNLFARIAAPNVVPRPYNLFTLAPPITPPDPRWSVGAMFDPLSCLKTAVWLDQCVSGAGDGSPKVVSDCTQQPTLQFQPFTVYSAIKRSGGDPDDVAALARTTLGNGESFGVEQYLWDRFVATFAPPAPSTNPTVALAAVEQALAANYMGQGLIHLSPSAATVLGQLGLIAAGPNTMHTVIGTPVVIGAGYDTPVNAIYGSGQVVVLRGTISEFDGMDRTVNDVVAYAERTYVVGWDCYLTGATFP